MKKYLIKTLFYFFLLSISSMAYADFIFGLNGSYSQLTDKRSSSYGFKPTGTGYGFEIGAKAGPFILAGSYSQSTLKDNILHDSIPGEFTLSGTSFNILLDTYITSRVFFGLGYRSFSHKVGLSGNFTSSSKSGAFNRYYLTDKSSNTGLLLRLGYSFWKSKTMALSGIYQRNMYSDNQTETQFLLNLRFFLKNPKFSGSH